MKYKGEKTTNQQEANEFIIGYLTEAHRNICRLYAYKEYIGDYMFGGIMEARKVISFAIEAISVENKDKENE